MGSGGETHGLCWPAKEYHNLMQTEDYPHIRPVMTKAEAADYLRVSGRQVQRWVQQRQIRAARLQRRVLFTRDELDRFVSLRMAAA